MLPDGSQPQPEIGTRPSYEVHSGDRWFMEYRSYLLYTTEEGRNVYQREIFLLSDNGTEVLFAAVNSLVGDIDVNNLTVADLRKTLKTRLSEYLPDPTVTVLLTQVNSLKAYVIGKVNRPGEFPITENTTVTQLLSMANGLNPFASADKISILRRQSGAPVRIHFNYKDIEKGQNLEQDILLRRGDVVVVP